MRCARLPCATVRGRGACVRVQAASSAPFVRVCTKTELAAKGGRIVLDVSGQQVLVQAVGDEVFAVSNKCSHLGISLQGKTPLLSAKVVDKCIVCPAHNTTFDLATGAVRDLPFVGKMKASTPLLAYAVQVEGDIVSVSV